MTPAAIIECATADGVRLTLSASGRLSAKGAQSDIDRWAPALRQSKDEIILLLRAGGDDRSVEDWRIFFDERIAIAEFNGGLRGAEAEMCAFKWCLAEWLVRNAAYSSPDRCFGCGGSELSLDPLLPVGIGGAGQVWLHSGCRPAWHSGRKTEAVAALAAMGIVAPADFSKDFWKNGGDACDERAALIELGAGVPRDWAEGYAALCTMPPPRGFTSARWQQIIDAAGVFLDRWGAKAAACGWSGLHVFGCDSTCPDKRIDCMGIVVLLDNGEVAGVDENGADVVTNTGDRQRFSRRPPPAATISLWQLVKKG